MTEQEQKTDEVVAWFRDRSYPAKKILVQHDGFTRFAIATDEIDCSLPNKKNTKKKTT